MVRQMDEDTKDIEVGPVKPKAKRKSSEHDRELALKRAEEELSMKTKALAFLCMPRPAGAPSALGRKYILENTRFVTQEKNGNNNQTKRD